MRRCDSNANSALVSTRRRPPSPPPPQEHRTEIDARAGTFQAFELFGQHLLQSNHYASTEVQEKLETMNTARQDLEK